MTNSNVPHGSLTTPSRQRVIHRFGFIAVPDQKHSARGNRKSLRVLALNFERIHRIPGFEQTRKAMPLLDA